MVRVRVLIIWMDMIVKVIDRAPVCIDDLVNVLWAQAVRSPGIGAGNQPLCLELVCIQEIPA
jgi:hypothetical protein